MSRFSIRFLTLFPLFLCGQLILSGQSIPEKIWEEGITFMKKGDYLRGIEKMEQFLEYVPLSQYALYNRGICRLRLGDQRGCCQDIEKAKALGFDKNNKLYGYFCDPEFRLSLMQKQFYKDIKLDEENGLRPVYTRADSLRGALRPERTCFDVFFYNLTVRIDPRKKSIRGKNEIWFKGIHTSRELQLDLFSNFQIIKIEMDGQPLSYRRDHQALFIRVPEEIKPSKDYMITVEYEGKPGIAPNPPWDGGFVWKRDKKLNRWAGVACEQLGASSWWPNKDHLSDRPDSMGINLEVPEKFQAVCNGRLRKIVDAGNKFKRYEWFVNYPINNYNVTFYMGKYIEFTDTIYWKDEKLIARYHVMPYNLDKAKEHFKQVREVINFYNNAFGPFPFWEDNFRMVESPYEGMEHQTAIAYGAAYDNKKNSITYVSKEFDYIIVHEAAHEWWGNSVTAADMADIWLHEGFATYAEYLFIEHMLGYEASMEEVNNHYSYIFNIWPLVQNRNVNEDAFASNDVYTKGATLLHCLRSTLDNDSLFRNMLHDFQMTYRDSVIDSDCFIDYVNLYTQKDFSSLFSKFLYNTDLPVLQYTYEHQGTDLLLRYKWIEVVPDFIMPFAVKPIDADEGLRFVATTQEQETVIKDAESFYFYQPGQSPAGCPHNGLTYYWTRNAETK
jgi:aminopeptidase N